MLSGRRGVRRMRGTVTRSAQAFRDDQLSPAAAAPPPSPRPRAAGRRSPPGGCGPDRRRPSGAGSARGCSTPASVAHRLLVLDVDQLDAGAQLHDEHVAVQREQVDHRAVEHVALRPGGPALLVLLELLDLGAQRRRQGRGTLGAHRPQQLRLLLRVPLLGRGLRVGLRRLDELPGRQHGVADPADLRRDAEHRGPPGARLRVPGEPTGDPDVALRRARRDRGDRRVDAVARDQQRGDRVDGRHAQRDGAAAGADGDQDVLRARRAQHPDRAAGGLLDRLEERVAAGVVQPVGVLDDDDPVPALRRRPLRELHQRAGGLGADEDALGRDDRDVRVQPAQGRGAVVADAAAAGRALQRRGERPGGVGPPRAGRAGEQPRVGHRGGVLDRVPQHLDRGLLADDVVPDAGHAATPRSGGARGARTAGRQLVDRPRRVEHEPAARLGLGAPEERLAGAPVELVAGPLQPVRVPRQPRPARDRVEVEQHRQRREQPVDGPQREALDLVGPQVPPAALVGHRRVEVPVGDDDRAAGERRPDQRRHVVRAVGRVEQRLGAGVDVVAVQDRVAQQQAELGAAGLARQDDLAAQPGQPVAEQARLRRLAGAVATLERDEQPGGRGRSTQGVGHVRQGSRRADMAAGRRVTRPGTRRRPATRMVSIVRRTSSVLSHVMRGLCVVAGGDPAGDLGGLVLQTLGAGLVEVPDAAVEALHAERRRPVEAALDPDVALGAGDRARSSASWPTASSTGWPARGRRRTGRSRSGRRRRSAVSCPTACTASGTPRKSCANDTG